MTSSRSWPLSEPDRPNPAPASLSDFRLGSIGLWMLGDIAGRALLVTVALSAPVILVSFGSRVPLFAFPIDWVLRSLASISVMILVYSIPVLVSIAIVWSYLRFTSTGVIIILRSVGRSARAIILPATIVSVAATVVGFVLANGLGPSGAREIHDTMFFVRRNLNLWLLEPGEFHHLEREGVTIFFAGRIDASSIYNVFVQQHATSERPEVIYLAESATVAGDPGHRVLILRDGTIISDLRDDAGVRQIDFENAVWRPTTAGTTRGYRFFDEMSTVQLISDAREAWSNPISSQLWKAEALKRFFFSWLTLAHAGLAVALLQIIVNGTCREPDRWISGVCVGGLLFVLHTVYVLLSEATLFFGATAAIGFFFLLVMQFFVTAMLLRRIDDPATAQRFQLAAARLFSPFAVLQAKDRRVQRLAHHQ